MQTVIDGQTIQIDDAAAPLLAAHPWKIRLVGGTAWRVLWHEYVRRADGCRRVVVHLFHREMYPAHTGNISFADGNPFHLCRANLVLHTTIAGRLENPYVPAELTALYEVHSVQSLTRDAAQRLGRGAAVADRVVYRWLQECGIKPRTHAEEAARAYALDRARRLSWLQKGQQTHAANVRAGRTPVRVDHLHTLAVKQKAKQALAQVRPPCACPWPEGQLRRYYAGQGWSLQRIAALAARHKGAGRVPHPRDVRRWLLDIEESIRTSAQQLTLEAHQRRAVLEKKRKQAGCPFDAPALRALYAQGRSPAIMAAYRTLTGDSIDKSTVCRWLKKADIDTGPYSPFVEAAVDCPYSAARLRELYWREGKSTSEIAALSTPLLGRERPVAPAVVTRWLRAAGVTLRTAAESQRVRARLHPEQFEPSIQAARAALTPEKRREIAQATGAGERMRSVQKKGAKAAAAKKKAERPWETRPCAYCEKPVTRPARMFRHPPDKTFCSCSCANKQRRFLIRVGEASETKWARQQPLRVERPCAQCGKTVRRAPCRMRAARVFCNTACACAWMNTQKKLTAG